MQDSSTDQLELFSDSPFSVRLHVGDTLRLFWDEYWVRTAKAKTTKKCFKRIASHLDAHNVRYVDEITEIDVEGLRQWLRSLGLKGNTINTHHMILTRWVNWLYECREVCKKKKTLYGIDFTKTPLPSQNPGSKVPKVNEKQFESNAAWSKRVVYKLVAAAQRMDDQYMADFMEGLYLSKLRMSDLSRVTEKNIDFPHRSLFGVQHKTVTRKLPSGVPFLSSIGPRLETILRRRLLEVQAGQPIFWNTTQEYEVWRREVWARFAVIRKAANLPHVQLRHFRHSSATLLLDNRVDVETLRESMGWTTLRMLPTYAKRNMAHHRDAQAILENEESEITR